MSIYFYKPVRQRTIRQTSIQQESTLKPTLHCVEQTNQLLTRRPKRNRNYEVPSKFPLLLIHPSLPTRIGLLHHSPHPSRLVCFRYAAA
jgi:hypothetical protein